MKPQKQFLRGSVSQRRCRIAYTPLYVVRAYGPRLTEKGDRRVKICKIPFRYFTPSPEIIEPRLLMYARFVLSPRNLKVRAHERGKWTCRDSVRPVVPR